LGTGGNSSVSADVSGNTMIRSPDWTLALSGNYKIPFESGTLDLSANLYHSAKIYYDVGDRISQPQYSTVGVQALWEFGDSGFDVAVWGKNLTSATVIAGTFIIVPADGVSYMAPRSVGLTARYRF
jgi:iron complex outermembrane receptor protein